MLLNIEELGISIFDINLNDINENGFATNNELETL